MEKEAIFSRDTEDNWLSNAEELTSYTIDTLEDYMLYNFGNNWMKKFLS